MIRALSAILVPPVAAMVPVVWLMMPPDRLPARFARADCHRVALIDPATGRTVTGAEDIALAPDGETLIVSAYDRIDPDRPDGNLYAVSALALDGGESVTAQPLVDRGALGEPLRPHGIALSRDGKRLAVINRVAPGEAEIEIGPLTADGWQPERRVTGERLCRANDLAFTGKEPDALEVSLDRADCTTSMRDLAPWTGTGRIARYDGDGLSIGETGFAFPNGVAGEWVAETRADRLVRRDGRPIALPGAPDNLTAVPGGLIVAVHPNLFRTWAYREGWAGDAPSRILRVDAESGAVEVLYDDPGGEQFSAATVGVLAGGRLIAGSVVDAGLLVCEPG